MSPVRTPPARYRRTDNNRKKCGTRSLRAAKFDRVRAGIVGGLRRASGGQECRAVEDARGFVADPLEHAADGAIVFGDAFLARRVGSLADARDERERAVEGANDVADADAVRGPPELVAAVRTFPALDQAAVFQRDQDVLEEFLGDGVVFGELADEHGPVAVLAGERQHGLETVFPLASQHQKTTKSTH